MNLSEALSEYANFWKYELDEIATGHFRVCLRFEMPDKSSRHQYVFVRKDNETDNERIFITSRCGEYNSSLDMYGILRAAMDCNYSAVVIFKERIGKKMSDMVVVQAAPAMKHTSIVLLGSIIYEVGRIADSIEQTFFNSEVDHY